MRRAPSSSHRSHMRAFTLVIFIALVVTLALLPPVVAGEPCSWLEEFESAYERGDSAAYAALLAPEFRFHFGDAENRSRRPQGWSKDEELASYLNLHRGVVREDGTRLPSAAAIDVQLAGVREGPDPDHPGSSDHRLAFVQAAMLFIRFADGSSAIDTAPHAFHLVRGRAIGRGGEEADTWFARKWIERPTEVPALLAALDEAARKAEEEARAAAEGAAGDAGETALAATQAALPARGLLWPNPVRTGGRVTLAFDLAVAAAEVGLEIFDVRGRVVARVGPLQVTAGRRSLTWDGRDDAGRTVAAGVYFVRARLGDREAQHRVIILR